MSRKLFVLVALLMFVGVSCSLFGSSPPPEWAWVQRDPILFGRDFEVVYRNRKAGTDGAEVNQYQVRAGNSAAIELEAVFGSRSQGYAQTFYRGGVSLGDYSNVEMRAGERFQVSEIMPTMENINGEKVCGVRIRIETWPGNNDRYRYDTLLQHSAPCTEDGRVDFSQAEVESVTISYMPKTQFRFGQRNGYGWSVTFKVEDGHPFTQLPSQWWAKGMLEDETLNVVNQINQYVAIMGRDEGLSEADTFDNLSVAATWTTAKFEGAGTGIKLSTPEGEFFYVEEIAGRPVDTEWNKFWQYATYIRRWDIKACRHGWTIKIGDNCPDLVMSGWQNSEAPTTEKHVIYRVRDDGLGEVIATIPMRSHFVTNFTQIPVVFGDISWSEVEESASSTISSFEYPELVKYNNGQRVEPAEHELRTWNEYFREMIRWEQADAMADVLVTFDVKDRSQYKQVICGSGEDTWVCGLDRTLADFQTQYYFDGEVEDLKRLYFILAGAGEVGVRMFGYSYANEPVNGSNLLPSLGVLLMSEYQLGNVELGPEFVYLLGSRSTGSDLRLLEQSLDALTD